MARFQPGQLVRLKSGGPPMTVKQWFPAPGRDGGEYRCQWFSGAKLSDGLFSEESIEPADAPERPPRKPKES
jgi:uncharacterized protein YodC (DUF2158 family)